MVEKKLVVMYGNCHLIILEKYLQKRPEFQRRYVVKRYYIADVEEKRRYSSENVLTHCWVLITQVIHEKNSFKVSSAKEMIKKISMDCKNIIIPNMYALGLSAGEINI